jgi:hypothetical protein
MPKITFDSDEEFEFDEEIAQQKPANVVDDDHNDSDSDDDAAPEAVSTSSLRNKAALEAKAQKDAALRYVTFPSSHSLIRSHLYSFSKAN